MEYEKTKPNRKRMRYIACMQQGIYYSKLGRYNCILDKGMYTDEIDVYLIVVEVIDASDIPPPFCPSVLKPRLYLRVCKLEMFC